APSNDVAASERALPEAVAEHGHARPYGDGVFGCRKESATDRPRIKKSNNDALTAATACSRVSWPVPTGISWSEIAAHCENEVVTRRRSRYRVYGKMLVVYTWPRVVVCR